MLSRAEYGQRWSVVHAGIDPESNVWVRSYLSTMYPIVVGLQHLRLSPNSVTIVGGCAAITATLLAADSHRWWLTAFVVLAGLLVDALDGALAIATSRESDFGHVIDSVMDRLHEVAMLVALWLLAGHTHAALTWMAWLAVIALEYARAKLRSLAPLVLESITVWERPTRVIVTMMAFVSAAVVGHAALCAQIALVVWAGLGVIAAIHYLKFARKSLK